MIATKQCFISKPWWNYIECREKFVEIGIQLIVNTPFVHFTNFRQHTFGQSFSLLALRALQQ